MLRIALCDDEQEDLAELEKMLREYLAQPDAPPAGLSVFSSGYRLLSVVEDKGDFDIYVLDVAMPELSGIELGKMLRGQNSRGIIIYLSVSAEYAAASYQAQAFYYLLKPVQKAELYEIMNRAVAAGKRQKAASLTLKTKDGWRLLSHDDIVYVELANRTALYHLANGEQLASTTLRASFREALTAGGLLDNPGFLLCGSSFAVNLYYVSALEKGGLRLDNGLLLPLPRALRAEARQRWSDFWLKGGAGL